MDTTSLDPPIQSRIDVPAEETDGTTVTREPPRVEPAAAPAPAPAPPKKRSRALGRLLEMADEFRRSDSLQQAQEIYFELFERYEDTPEAEQAEDRLLDLARVHEQNGEQHAARAIYERLLKNEH